MNLKLKRTPGIYLVGFMGCGKSTVGRLFAEEIGWRFADLDQDIEGQQKTTITDLFHRFGEEQFRRMETAAIQKRVQAVRRGSPTVLSLGGGAFTREENIELLTENGITVWVDTSFDIMRERVAHQNHRPLARDPQRFRQLYEERLQFYERAEFRIEETNGDSRAALRKLIDLCLFE
ncbi:MAG: shikimate kinase [Bryobacteraceae bacterium]|nr:shikimate kinase [Bryobacteraceae bacterium]